MEKPIILRPLPPQGQMIFSRQQKLNSLKDVTRLQGRLINLCLMGRLDENLTSKFVMMLSALAKTLETSEIEARIKQQENIENQSDERIGKIRVEIVRPDNEKAKLKSDV